MKKIIFFLLLSGTAMTALGNNGDPVPSKKVLNVQQKKSFVCGVTVTMSGNASGVDCRGVFYSDGVFGTCTQSAETCESAFIAAQSCANTARSANTTARHDFHRTKCDDEWIPPAE